MKEMCYNKSGLQKKSLTVAGWRLFLPLYFRITKIYDGNKKNKINNFCDKKFKMYGKIETV